MKIIPIHPMDVDIADDDTTTRPEAVEQRHLSRRTFGKRFPSRRTFGRKFPSRRTFGKRIPYGARSDTPAASTCPQGQRPSRGQRPVRCPRLPS